MNFLSLKENYKLHSLIIGAGVDPIPGPVHAGALSSVVNVKGMSPVSGIVCDGTNFIDEFFPSFQ